MAINDQIKVLAQVTLGDGGGSSNADDLTSGTVALARGGTNADLSATGGTGHVLKQSSAGANITVGALTASDIPSTLNATTFAGAVTIGNNYIEGGGASGYTVISNQSTARFAAWGSSSAYPGANRYSCGSVAGSNHQFFDKNGAEQLRVDENGVYALTYFQALLGIHTGGSNYALNISGGVSAGAISNSSSGAQYHVEGSAYPSANLTWAPLRTRTASTAFAVCPVATGDVAKVQIFDDTAASSGAIVRVDSAGTVTFDYPTDAKYVNTSSPGAAEIGVYISAGVLYAKPGASITPKLAHFDLIGKA